MKTYPTPFFLLAFFLVACISSSASAQQMKSWTWTQYGIGFQTPTSMQVTTNNSSQFVASGNGMTVKIEPWSDATQTAEQIARKAYDRTNATDKYIEKKTSLSLNGFQGYEILGDGYQNGRALVFLSMGLVDPNSATNFLVTILWWDDAATHSQQVALAERIAKSFYRL
jgi:hypothetical protein